MKKSVAGMQTFSFGQDLVFDAFIQFKVILSPERDFKHSSIIGNMPISGVHWICQVHECHERDEAVLQGQGQ